MNVLSLQNVEYSYTAGAAKVLRGVTAEFERGKIYAVAGKSGSGKSTLLSLLAGLDICRSGSILYNGSDMKTLDRDAYRAKSVGVIFQSFNLLLNLTALENIVLAMEISEVKISDKKAYAYALLDKVGIDKETAGRKVLKLSGGEQQRVCIARALSHDPDVILADEPTGNLDGENEQAVLDIMQSLAHNDNRCVIIVTHDQTVIDTADVVLRLTDGKFKAAND